MCRLDRPFVAEREDGRVQHAAEPQLAMAAHGGACRELDDLRAAQARAFFTIQFGACLRYVVLET